MPLKFKNYMLHIVYVTEVQGIHTNFLEPGDTVNRAEKGIKDGFSNFGLL